LLAGGERLPRRHVARFDPDATCHWVRIRRARRTRPQSLGQECKSVATFQRFLIATARLAVDPERIRAVVNLRYAVLSSGCVAVVADAVASSKGSKRTCDDNDRQSQHDFDLHGHLLLVLKANFLCRSDGAGVVFIPGWFDAVITAALCTERFDFVLTRACIRRRLAQCKLPYGSVRRVAHIGVDSLRTRSAILRLSSSTAYPPASPSCDHGGRRNLESKGFERQGELIIAVRKKTPPGKQGINLTGLQSDPWK